MYNDIEFYNISHRFKLRYSIRVRWQKNVTLTDSQAWETKTLCFESKITTQRKKWPRLGSFGLVWARLGPFWLIWVRFFAAPPPLLYPCTVTRKGREGGARALKRFPSVSDNKFFIAISIPGKTVFHCSSQDKGSFIAPLIHSQLSRPLSSNSTMETSPALIYDQTIVIKNSAILQFYSTS